jgi:hypothetical protein
MINEFDKMDNKEKEKKILEKMKKVETENEKKVKILY